MATYSVVAHDGAIYGPVDETGLVEWIRQGRVIRDTVLLCHETNARSAAWTVPALQQTLGLSPAEVTQLLHSISAPTSSAPASSGPRPPALPSQFAPAASIPINYAQPFYGGANYPMVSTFPVAGAVVLSILFPLFPLIYYGMVHGNLPKRRPDDPGAGKAIGFMFIPFFSIYWMCFFWTRLCTRINDERTLLGMAPTAPRDLVIAICWCCLGLIIPFLNILVMLGISVMLIIAVIQIQTSLNGLADVAQRR